jgi:uncharacterized membrane-anchored protein
MKKKVFLSVAAFAMLALWILFRYFFYIDGFSEWFVYFPVAPFIFSFICLFNEKKGSSYKSIIGFMIGILLSLTLLSTSQFNITSVSKILSTLAGCGVAIAIVYYVRKQA